MEKQESILQEHITNSIYLIRGHKVMMDSELAKMYGVKTSRLNEQVKRNIERFPEDFMFQLTQEEWENLKSHFATSSLHGKKNGWGGRRKTPLMFTEQGVAMLSSVLTTPVAIQVNISIMRVFVKMRQWAANYEDLMEKIKEISQTQTEHSEHIQQIYQIIEELVRPALTERKPIGFKRNK
jgi:hypothetical protein